MGNGLKVDFVPDALLWPNRINDGLADATHQFHCSQQSAGACVDYDGKSTEGQKCGFGALNRRFGTALQVGHHCRNTLRIGARTFCDEMAS
jgi:hypothetical protein